MHDHHRGYRYEFLDSDAGPGPDPITETTPYASGRGSGPLGFAGTARRAAAAPAGLARLRGDAFGSGPSVPMVPRTWEADELENENDFH
jgi:PPE-repeat protein